MEGVRVTTDIEPSALSEEILIRRCWESDQHEDELGKIESLHPSELIHCGTKAPVFESKDHWKTRVRKRIPSSVI